MNYWTIVQVIDILHELFYFERACAHLLAGWNPKIQDMGIKVVAATHLFQDMEHANLLYNDLLALSKIQNKQRLVPIGWQRVVVRIDQSEDPNEFLCLLYLFIKKQLLKTYHSYLNHVDPIPFALSLSEVKRIVMEESEQLTWAKQTIKRYLMPHDKKKIIDSVRKLWNNRFTIHHLKPHQVSWPVLDRVPRVARPQKVWRGETGAIRRIPFDPLHSHEGIGLFLHNFLNEEYTTLELICRNIYEHPDMPWQFHLDMARHAYDESRHAQMIERMALNYGVRYGDYPIYVSSYEGQYSFKPCKPGSKKELLWRILLRQTFHEGLALDSLAFEVRKRTFLKQSRLAQLFSFLLADEVFHAKSGLKWSRYLCGNDAQKAMKERSSAHTYFMKRIKQSRAKFIAENQEKAIEEVKMLEKIEEIQKKHELPFRRSINLEARREAGFMDEEIRQIINWGYVENIKVQK